MGRILAIDYGTKRVGLAVTDPDKIIASPLTTIHPDEVVSFIRKFLEKEKIECFVIGDPKNLNGTPAQVAPMVEAFIQKLNKNFPDIPVKKMDERFTSKIAMQTMIMGGYKKKDRRNKENLDKISASLILQNYLQTVKA